MKTVQKIQKDKIFKVTTQKNGQSLQNGQVKKWPNFLKLAMKWPIWQPWPHATKRLL